MDRLEHKLGREGLKTRVRTVRGKENLARSPNLMQEAAAMKRVSCPVSARSPLRSNMREATTEELKVEEVLPATGNQLPRTPVSTHPQQFIPKGKGWIKDTLQKRTQVL